VKSKYLLVALIVLVIANIGATAFFKIGESANIAAEKIVTFDTSRYLNARKHVASKVAFSSSEDVKSEAISIIARVDKHARKVIEQKAAGRLVILTQAMALTDQVEDITNDVLLELGLPTDVPTISVDINEGAATNYRNSSLYETAKNNLMKKSAEAAEWEKAEAQKNERLSKDKWLP